VNPCPSGDRVLTHALQGCGKTLPNISKKEHPHRDLSTALRFGRDDKGEDGASRESSCQMEAVFSNYSPWKR
jgi:hypothetical protein